jgi:hypothetical protein
MSPKLVATIATCSMDAKRQQACLQTSLGAARNTSLVHSRTHTYKVLSILPIVTYITRKFCTIASIGALTGSPR